MKKMYGYVYDTWPHSKYLPFFARTDFYWAVTSLTTNTRFHFGIYDEYRFGFLAYVQYSPSHDCDNCPTCQRLKEG